MYKSTPILDRVIFKVNDSTISGIIIGKYSETKACALEDITNQHSQTDTEEYFIILIENKEDMLKLSDYEDRLGYEFRLQSSQQLKLLPPAITITAGGSSILSMSPVNPSTTIWKLENSQFETLVDAVKEDLRKAIKEEE